MIPRRVRLDDRQADRLGTRPRRGAGAPAPRARRDDGRRRRRHDQPGLPARAARSPRGAGGRRSTPAGSTACSCAARSCRCATPTWRCCRPRSSSATPRRRPTARASTPTRGAGGPQTGSASRRVVRPALPRPVLPARGLADRAGPLPDPGRRRRRRGRDAAGRAPRAPARPRRAPTTGPSPRCRAPSCSSRSTASRTGSRATTAASCAAWRPRSSCRSRSPRATRSQAGDVVAVLESMKMETSLIAPFRGRVRQRPVGPQRPGRRPGSAAPARGARRRRGPSHRGRRRADRVRGTRRAARSSAPCAASSG